MPSNESFDTLVRELVENNISSLVSQRISELVTTDMLSRFIVNRIDQRINEFTPDTSAFDHKIADASLMIVDQIQAKANQFVDDTLKSRLGSLDIHSLAREHISNFLASAEVSTQAKIQVEKNIGSLVSQRISELVTTDMLSRFIVNRVDQRINEFMPDTSAFDHKVADASLMIVNQIQAKANQFVDDTLKSRLGSLDIHALAREHISNFLASMNTRFFPDNYIPGHAIDKSGFMISGNNVNGGIIKNFSSVGIDDRSNSCKMTVLDQGVVLEDTLYATRIEIKGDAVIDGDILIKGKIPESSPAFQNLVRDSAAMVKQMVAPDIISTFQVSIFDRIKNEGIEVDNLSVNGQKLIDGQKLSYGVVDSNLQSVGILRDLQTRGENLLSETLYVTKNRVGINTMDPVTALSVWDEEIELYIGKQKQNTARISAQRGNNLIVGSNSQDNIICTPDGNVQVKQIKVGNINISSSATPPSYDAPSGSIVLNENPGIGGPIGWVSLGHARWANFGIID